MISLDYCSSSDSCVADVILHMNMIKYLNVGGRDEESKEAVIRAKHVWVYYGAYTHNYLIENNDKNNNA